jgi:hypothetical protein
MQLGNCSLLGHEKKKAPDSFAATAIIAGQGRTAS